MKIKLLDASVANKIAAGEVVERPASIVKELVENSIDAKATNVTVEIKGGGIELIRITDNGSGMEEEDVKNAFLRHATSKITVAEDLNDIITLGFRGEALASISAVSKVSLVTRTKNAVEGTRIELTGGVIDRFFPAGCAEGTSISVMDLFFNTPARRKFLKKPAQESAYIQETVNRLALSNPSIAIRFVIDGKTVLRTPGDGSLLSAIRAVFGQDVSGNMIKVDQEKNGISVTGYIGNRELQRNNRTRQILFINGRSVKNETVSSAVQDGYQGRLNIGKFPFFVIEMRLSGNQVDVNVHPTKQEVRFSDGLPVYETVSSIIRDTLRSNEEIPTLFKQEEKKEQVKIFEVETVDPKKTEEKEDFKYDPKAPLELDEIYKPLEVLFEDHPTVLNDKPYSPILNREKRIELVAERETVQEEITLEIEDTYKIAGVLFDTYIILEMGDDGYLIDQHAAHERLLFERLFASLETEKTSQLLLLPQIVKLSPQEAAVILELLPQLEEMGFEIDDIGYNSLAVKAVPEALSEINAEKFFSSLIEDGIKNLRTNELKRAKLMQMACKSAIKGGDKLSESDIKKLLRLIKEEGIPLSCPHGRPILIRLTKHELEVRFKRIQ
ncbi:MAG: DNA mismatch repair endonuclease MutL [Clostridia bacterium]|nr:DNA mismatch repair endonuclease MutL [Clostridia bacterium]